MTSEDEKTLYLVGGYDGSVNVWTQRKNLLMMQCHSGNCTWTELDHKLKIRREAATAMLIPDSLANCET